jgi:hypothetical protein
MLGAAAETTERAAVCERDVLTELVRIATLPAQSHAYTDSDVAEDGTPAKR